MNKFKSILPFVLISFVTVLFFQNCGKMTAQKFLNKSQSQTNSSDALAQLFKIEWSVGPQLPIGLQDSGFGIIDDELISAQGFSEATRDSGVGGFISEAMTYKLGSDSWQSVSNPLDIPARQGAASAVVGNALYMWGGFDRDGTLKDGFKISKIGTEWQWETLPDLPLAMSSASTAVIGTKIYIIGGADFDEHGYYTYRKNNLGTFNGSQVLMIDTAQLDQGWKTMAPLPGSPRFVSAVTSIKNKIYVFGGATGNDNFARSSNSGATCTVLDNWVYDVEKNSWSEIAHTPIASGNFSSGLISYQDRYVFLFGGYDYGYYSWGADPYCQNKKNLPKPFSLWPKNGFYSDILVYDTLNNTFSQAGYLPLTNNLPGATISGHTIHLIGGESTRTRIGGIEYGHRPSLYLTGQIRPLSAVSESIIPGVTIYSPRPEGLQKQKNFIVAGVCQNTQQPVTLLIHDTVYETPCNHFRFEQLVSLSANFPVGQFQIRAQQDIHDSTVSDEVVNYFDDTGSFSQLTVTSPLNGSTISSNLMVITGKCHRHLNAFAPVTVAFGSQSQKVDCIDGQFSAAFDAFTTGNLAIRADQMEEDGTRVSSPQISILKTN